MTDASETPAQQRVRIATLLLADPFTDLTRRRQTSVLVTSGAALLVSLSVVTPGSEATLLGFKFTVEKAAFVTLILGLLSLYFALAYGIGAYQDIKVFEYTLHPALKEFMEVQRRARQAARDLATHVDRVQDLLGQRGDLVKQAETIRAQYDVKLKSVRGGMQREADEVSQLQSTQVTRPLSPARTRALDQYDELDAEYQSIKAQQERDVQALEEKISAVSVEIVGLQRGVHQDIPEDRSASEQFDALEKSLDVHVRLKTWRAWMEIGFPLALALLAVGSSVTSFVLSFSAPAKLF